MNVWTVDALSGETWKMTAHQPNGPNLLSVDKWSYRIISLSNSFFLSLNVVLEPFFLKGTHELFASTNETPAIHSVTVQEFSYFDSPNLSKLQLLMSF